MITTANCKINIGLNILERRDDGYHNLSSLFYPVKSLYDIVEVIKSDSLQLSTSGILVDGEDVDNLCVKAYHTFAKRYNISGAKIHLHKQIPLGAGLGGGSSDAAAVIKLLNNLYDVKATDGELAEVALLVGSDVPFFIYNKPMLVSGRGEKFSECDIDLSGLYINIIKPSYSISTAEAYSGIKPRYPQRALSELIKCNISDWRDNITNDFEESVFNEEMTEIKSKLYDLGATYVSMSGSGSAIFAISEGEITDIDKIFKEYYIHKSVIL